MRAFIAIDLPSEVKQFLSTINTNTSDLPGIKTVNPENMHLTIKFLGDINNSKEVIEKLKKISFQPFQLTAARIGFFPNKSKIKVMWFGINESEELINLHKEIGGLFGELEEYKPHLTFARVKFLKKGTKEKLFSELEKYKDKTFKFKVEKYRLYSSELTPLGPIHRVVETFQ